jgi:alpha-1,6-mannosyltransferase
MLKPSRLIVLGCVGMVLIAVSSWWVGAIPVSLRTHRPGVMSWLAIGSPVARGGFYVGLTLALVAWLMLGRQLDRASPPQLRWATAWWAAPLVLAAPIGSRDLWAYAAQGNLIGHGFGPYTSAPARLPGPFLDNVAGRWTHSSAPYGPLWLDYSRLVAQLCGHHVVLSMLALRLAELVGLALCVWAISTMAGARALWLTALNPLTLVLTVGGGHNDVVMVGLMLVAVAVTTRPGSVLSTLGVGAAIIALAGAVKSPALVALPFLVPIWLSTRKGVNLLVAGAIALASASATFAIVTVASGFGVGWIHQVNSETSTVNWMSIPTTIAMLVKLASGTRHGIVTVDAPMEHLRQAGLAVAAVVIVGLWLASLRARSSMVWLSAALFILTVLGPAVQVWYFLWTLAFLALLPLGRQATSWIVSSSLALVLMVRPNGVGLQMQPAVLAVLAFAGVVGWLALRSVPGDDDADSAGPGMRTDDGAHL